MYWSSGSWSPGKTGLDHLAKQVLIIWQAILIIWQKILTKSWRQWQKRSWSSGQTNFDQLGKEVLIIWQNRSCSSGQILIIWTNFDHLANKSWLSGKTVCWLIAIQVLTLSQSPVFSYYWDLPKLPVYCGIYTCIK